MWECLDLSRKVKVGMGRSRLVKEGRGWDWKVYLSPGRSGVGMERSRLE